MRAFIAFPIPESIKDYLRDIQRNLKKCDLHAKWVNPDNIHMTLKFLGDIDQGLIPSIENNIKETASCFSSLELHLTQFGFFPNERNPRVFFIATDQDKILKNLASSLEGKLEEMGFAPENKFKSHLTLARFKSKKNIPVLLERIKNMQIKKSFSMHSIILYKSTLTPQGPIYSDLFSVGLMK